jgi:hypothetical protein
MFKKISFLIISIVLLTACNNNSEDSKYNIKDPKNTLKNVPINIETTQILFDGKRVSFDLSLSRPDLKIKETDYEKEMALTVDLPLTLQPRLIYAGEPNDENFNDGYLCDRPRFPHRCEYEIAANETSHQFMIRIVFEDDTYTEKLIDVEIPTELPKSEITYPTTAPTENSTFKMTFIDVGADKYEAEFRLCKPYGNDGINPCLDGGTYYIYRENGKLSIANDYNVYPISLTEKDGSITLQSTFPLWFEESVEYVVTATKDSKNSTKIPVITTSTNSISFSKK